MKEPNPAATARKLEYERANLQYMLVHPESVGETTAYLTVKDFNAGFHRSVYEAIVQAYESGAPTSTSTFFTAVRARLGALLPDMEPPEVSVKLGTLIGPS